ncbi:MAG: hypothetical protein F4X58_13645 [Chloroflexi bacterium]|nr:hypothetical protein [Chloroflexota bacterium]MYC02949.1 hypothetical protein [Chloroflexota bacterium]
MVAEGTGAIEAGIPRLAVEGDLPEDGLATYGDNGDDLMMALARKLVLDFDRGLVSGETDSEPVEDIFNQAQQVTVQADQLLVDADWQRPAREPEPVVSLPSGGDESGIELVPCGGHHGSPESQQSLFSLAEFLSEQPDKPKSRGRSAQPSGAPLLDWALEREQQAGLVTAGG